MNTDDFRIWCYYLWIENCSERREYNYPELSFAEYFKMYKFWLKNRYQEEKRNSKKESNLAMSIALDDKFNSSEVTLLSNIQNKLVKTLKGKNEK